MQTEKSPGRFLEIGVSEAGTEENVESRPVTLLLVSMAFQSVTAAGAFPNEKLTNEPQQNAKRNRVITQKKEEKLKVWKSLGKFMQSVGKAIK